MMINEINSIIMESQIQTCLCMENYLDKIYNMLEYGYEDSEYVDNMIQEAYEIYLEATDRRKKADQIDKALKEYGFDIDSSKPAKRKKARQIRNVLLQHDFVPTGVVTNEKDGHKYRALEGTIRSDVDTTSRKNLMGDVTIQDIHKQKMQKKIKQKEDPDDPLSGISSALPPSNSDRDKKRENIENEAKATKSYNRVKLIIEPPNIAKISKDGGDAYYRSSEKSIHVGDDNLSKHKRGNYWDLDWLLHHEKGHHKDHASGAFDRWSSEQIHGGNPHERGIKQIRESKRSGFYVDTHDDGSYLSNYKNENPLELEAELNAAQKSRVRTKYAGRKRAMKRSGGVRKLTNVDIAKHYGGLSDKLRGWQNTPIRKIYDEFKQFQNRFPEWHRALMNCCDFEDYYKRTLELSQKPYQFTGKLSDLNDLTATWSQRVSQVMDNLKEIIKYSDNISDVDFRKFQKLHELPSSILECKEYLEEILSDLQDVESNDPDNKKYIEKLKNEINCARKELSIYYNDYNKYVKDLEKYKNHVDLTKIVSAIEDVRHITTDIELRNGKDITGFFNKVNNNNARAIDQMNKLNKAIHIIQQTFLKIVDTIKLDCKIESLIENYDKSVNKIDKLLKLSPNQVLYDFVTKHINESFEELFDDYYSFENFGIYVD